MQWRRLQPFGYAAVGQSLLHDTGTIVREVAQYFDMVPPADGGNRSNQEISSDLTTLFRTAYNHKYRSISLESIQRIEKDVEEYRKTGTLPYYMLRVWCGYKHGEAAVSAHTKCGQQPL
jgi:hypothetical protein